MKWNSNYWLHLHPSNTRIASVWQKQSNKQMQSTKITATWLISVPTRWLLVIWPLCNLVINYGAHVTQTPASPRQPDQTNRNQGNWWQNTVGLLPQNESIRIRAVMNVIDQLLTRNTTVATCWNPGHEEPSAELWSLCMWHKLLFGRLFDYLWTLGQFVDIVREYSPCFSLHSHHRLPTHLRFILIC